MSKKRNGISNSKRGQMALFLILGIILLGAIGSIALYMNISRLSEYEQEVKREFLASPQAKLTTMVESCIHDSLDKRAEQIAAHGGMILPDLFRMYRGNTYTYWCLQEDGSGCVNRILTRHEMQRELSQAVGNDVASCLNWSGFMLAGFEIETGNLSVESTIAPRHTEASITFPITLNSESKEVSISEFSGRIDIELGLLYEVALQILYEELLLESFDKDRWMAEHSADFTIEKHRPYPDTVYSIRKYNPIEKRILEWRFALQGQDTADEPGEIPAIQPLPACRLPDNTIYAQSRSSTCQQKGGTVLSSPPMDWEALARIPTASRERDNCGFYEDGESWCEYQGPVGLGMDYVGSRHVKKSCHDGEILIEECRDYREELCTQTDDRPYQAVCRENRWQDCALQSNQAQCLNTDHRDCYWNDGLLGQGHKSYGKQYNDLLCHPQVPPGFRFWQKNPSADAVCSMGNEQMNCDGFNCPQNWVDTSAIYCSSLGDCGNYRNVNNEITNEGFLTEAGQGISGPRAYTMLSESATDQTYRLTLPVDALPMQSHRYTYTNPYASPQKILEARHQYIATASGWDECDICKCVLGIPVPGCQFKKYFHARNICSLWDAPDSGDCGSCGDRGFPCTEYWCRSLGKDCTFFENETGYGICSDTVATQEPLRIRNVSLTKNVPLLKDILIYGGKTYVGYRVMEPLKPYDLVGLNVTLNHPGRCTVRGLELVGMGENIIYSSSNIMSEHNIALSLIPQSNMVEDVVENFGFSNVVQAAIPDQVDRRFNQLVQMHPDIEDQVSGPIHDWETTLAPELRAQIDDIEAMMRQRAMDIVSNIVTVQLDCVDQSGSETESAVIQYELLEDTFMPEMVRYNGTLGEFNQFQIVLNEPVECKFDSTDVAWEQMRFHLECPSMGYGLLSSEMTCYGDASGLGDQYHGPVNIRCRDQPTVWKNFTVRINKTNQFSLDSPFQPRYLKLTKPNIIMINKTTLGLSQLPAFKVNTSAVDLKLRFPSRKECVFNGSIPNMPHTIWDCDYFGSSWGCDVTLISQLPNRNITEYPIRCHGVEDMNEQIFTIEI